MEEDRPTMSAQEAADYLRLSKPTVLKLWAQRLIKGYRALQAVNGRVRLYRDSVEEFDRQRKSQVPTAK